jgi:nicotinamide-nucleotide adenylyltransferase
MSSRMDHFNRIGMIGRWRPVHQGHAVVLRSLCDRAGHALIGVGSSNRYNLRNPFTDQETMDMIRLVLTGRLNYTLIPVPDLDDGPRWREMVLDLFGPLDLFVTENPYVASLLQDDYRIVRPIELISENDRIPLDGTMVRKEMARGDSWRYLVPEAVADYIEAGRLDDRFRREFGLQTLAQDVIVRL